LRQRTGLQTYRSKAIVQFAQPARQNLGLARDFGLLEDLAVLAEVLANDTSSPTNSLIP